MSTPAEEASSLAAMINALRDITQAQEQGGTWAEIGARLGMSGPEAKKEAHRLREQVKQALAARAARAAAVREELAAHVEQARALTPRPAPGDPGPTAP